MLWRGTIFRIKAKYPYENQVDFMLYETSYNDYPLGLIVTTGYHAGQKVLFVFPEESFTKKTINGFEGKIFAIDKNWIIANWQTHIHEDCAIEDVYVSEGYNLLTGKTMPNTSS